MCIGFWIFNHSYYMLEALVQNANHQPKTPFGILTTKGPPIAVNLQITTNKQELQNRLSILPPIWTVQNPPSNTSRVGSGQILDAYNNSDIS